MVWEQPAEAGWDLVGGQLRRPPAAVPGKASVLQRLPGRMAEGTQPREVRPEWEARSWAEPGPCGRWGGLQDETSPGGQGAGKVEV